MKNLKKNYLTYKLNYIKQNIKAGGNKDDIFDDLDDLPISSNYNDDIQKEIFPELYLQQNNQELYLQNNQDEKIHFFLLENDYTYNHKYSSDINIYELLIKPYIKQLYDKENEYYTYIIHKLIDEIKIYIVKLYELTEINNNIQIILKLITSGFDYNFQYSPNINIYYLFVKKYIKQLSEEQKINLSNQEKIDLINEIKIIIIKNINLSKENLNRKISHKLNSFKRKLKKKKIINSLKKNNKSFLQDIKDM